MEQPIHDWLDPDPRLDKMIEVWSEECLKPSNEREKGVTAEQVGLPPDVDSSGRNRIAVLGCGALERLRVLMQNSDIQEVSIQYTTIGGFFDQDEHDGEDHRNPPAPGRIYPCRESWKLKKGARPRKR